VGPPGERARGVPPATQPLGCVALARIVAVAPDLLFGSRIEGTLRSAGHEVTLSPSLSEAPLDEAGLLIADLEVEQPEALVGLGMPVLGYYQHTDVETREAAEAAGVDLAVPRSRMAREMADLVERLLSDEAT
jgi:hypothetical protein